MRRLHAYSYFYGVRLKVLQGSQNSTTRLLRMTRALPYQHPFYQDRYQPSKANERTGLKDRELLIMSLALAAAMRLLPSLSATLFILNPPPVHPINSPHILSAIEGAAMRSERETDWYGPQIFLAGALSDTAVICF